MKDNTQVLTGYIRLPQVLKLIPVGRVTWWNGCKTGLYPKPYKIAPRITAWKISDIQNCLDGFQQTGN
jgi:prophage regulatory protein